MAGSKACPWSFYICSAARGLLCPPCQGNGSFEKASPRFFAAGGLDFTTEDPLWSPFSRGTKEPDQRSGLRHSRESRNDPWQAQKPAPLARPILSPLRGVPGGPTFLYSSPGIEGVRPSGLVPFPLFMNQSVRLEVASDLIRRVKESGLDNPILIEPPRRQERQDEIAERPGSSVRFRLMAPLMNAASDLCVLGVLGGSNLTVL
jgi:hypothetical protein